MADEPSLGELFALLSGHRNCGHILSDEAKFHGAWNLAMGVLHRPAGPGLPPDTLALAASLVVMFSRPLHPIPLYCEDSVAKDPAKYGLDDEEVQGEDRHRREDFGAFLLPKTPLQRDLRFLQLEEIAQGTLADALIAWIVHLLDARGSEAPETATAIDCLARALCQSLPPQIGPELENKVVDLILRLVEPLTSLTSGRFAALNEILATVVDVLPAVELLTAEWPWKAIEVVAQVSIDEEARLGLTNISFTYPWIITHLLHKVPFPFGCVPTVALKCMEKLPTLIEKTIWTIRASLEEANLWLAAELLVRGWRDIQTAEFRHNLGDLASETDPILNLIAPVLGKKAKDIAADILEASDTVPPERERLPGLLDQLRLTTSERFDSIRFGPRYSLMDPLYRLFWSACENGDVSIVQQIQKGIAPWEFVEMVQMGDPMDTNKTGLHKAVQCNATNLVELLLTTNPTCVDKADTQGWTALLLAAWVGNAESAEVLIAHGASLAQKDEHGYTAFHAACHNGTLAMAKLLLDRTTDLESTSNDGSTPLVYACEGGYIEVAKLLLDTKRCDINAGDGDGCGPLHFAARDGNLDLVKLLLERGADPLAKTDDNEEAIFLASEGGHVEVVKILHEAGSNLNHACADGTTCLTLAIHQNRYEVAKYLLEHGADPNLPPQPEEDTFLNMAVAYADVKMVELLLHHKADPTVASYSTLPIHWAAELGRVDSIKALVAHGVSHSTPLARNKSTPLHIAFAEGQVASILTLVELGANLGTLNASALPAPAMLKTPATLFNLLKANSPLITELDLFSVRGLKHLSLEGLAESLEHNEFFTTLLMELPIVGDQYSFVRRLWTGNSNLEAFTFKGSDRAIVFPIKTLCGSNWLRRVYDERKELGLDFLRSLHRTMASPEDPFPIQIGPHYIQVSKVVAHARGALHPLINHEEALASNLSDIPKAAVDAFVRFLYIGELPFDPSVDPSDVWDSEELRGINDKQYMDYMRNVKLLADTMDWLEMRCAVTQHVDDHLTKMRVDAARLSHQKVFAQFEDLLKGSVPAAAFDFVLVSNDNVEVKCHSAVLGLRCAWFSKMTHSNMRDAKSGRVTTELDGVALEGFVRYLYTGQVSQFDDPEKCAQILQAFDYYRLEDTPGHSDLLSHLKQHVDQESDHEPAAEEAAVPPQQ